MWGWLQEIGRGFARAALVAVMALAPLGGALAAPEKRVALVIGNGGYEHAPALANPVEDAKAVAAALRRLGLDVTEGYDLSGRDMRSLLIKFANAMPGSKGALVYYAGHGVAVDGVNYMLPTDIDLKSPADLDLDGFSLDVVLRQMRRDERVNVVILDACRDNPFAAALAGAAVRAVVTNRGLDRMDSELARGVMIAFATEPGKSAFDGASGQHSPFAAALLRHIEDKGATIDTVMSRVRQEVYAATDSKQLPWVNSSIIGDFVLNPEVAAAPAVPASAPADAAAASATEDLLWQSAERSGAPEDYKTYLDTYPKGVFAPLAQRRIAAHEPSPEAAEAQLQIGAADRIAAQGALNALGFGAGAADGVFGPTARAAISTWQSQRGLPATGFFAKDQLARLVDEAPKPAAPAAAPATKAAPVLRAARAIAVAPPKPIVAVAPKPAPHKERAARSHAGERRYASDRAPRSDEGGSVVRDAANEPAPAAPGTDGSVGTSGYAGPLFSGGFGIGFGGGHHHWSDRRLKRDVCLVGASPSGLPIYTYRYIVGDAYYRGVMAQDLLRLRPQAVSQVGPYYAVDYSAIDAPFERLDAPPAACPAI